MSSLSTGPWFPLAQLLRPQGRRGELLADPLTDREDAFRDGQSVWLATSGEPSLDAAPLTLEAHWQPTGRNAGRVVLKLSAANSINEAETLSGKRLFLPAQAAPKLDADTWFVRDLIGCTLLDHGQPVGPVVDVEFATTPDGRTRLDDAAPLLAVELPSGEQALIPFIRAWVTAVDPANKQIAMDLPEGLIVIGEEGQGPEAEE